MRKAKAQTILFVLLLLSLFCCYGVFALSDGNAQEMTGSALSENVVSEALEIINTAGEEGLTDTELNRLAALGLTDAQIEMLKNFSLAESAEATESIEHSPDSWVTESLTESQNASALLSVCGILLAGGLIGLLSMLHKQIERRKIRHSAKHRHFLG